MKLKILLTSILLLGAGCAGGSYVCTDHLVTDMRFECKDGKSGCTTFYTLDNGRVISDYRSSVKQNSEGYFCEYVWE